MKHLIVANWKMNPSAKEEAVKLFNKIKKGIQTHGLVYGSKVEVVVCPPLVYLTLFKWSALSEVEGLALGTQNVFYEEKGAYTGEVSPLMLKDLGVEYVIVGHSERRALGETSEAISKKIKVCLENGLKPILCVGEREGPASAQGSGEAKEKKEEVLKKQIEEGLKGISSGNIVIAYEPVWAIGTGKNCSIKETKKSVELIKKLTSQDKKVLYGGSVNGNNAKDYLENAGVDGLLVGGASLKADEFIKIVASAA